MIKTRVEPEKISVKKIIKEFLTWSITPFAVTALMFYLISFYAYALLYGLWQLLKRAFKH